MTSQKTSLSKVLILPLSTSLLSFPPQVGLQRAARTDRGVHAAGNLLTLKLILDPPTVLESHPPVSGESEGTSLIKYVNSLLPPFIRIWGFNRVQNSFNARTSCDSRQYEYLLPTHVFLPPKNGSAMHGMLKGWLEIGKERRREEEEEALNGGKLEGEVAGGEGDGNTGGLIGKKDDEKNKLRKNSKSLKGALNEEQTKALEGLVNHEFWKFLKEENNSVEATSGNGEGNVIESIFQSDLKKKKQWRISKDQVERIRSITKQYEGSHNFHNFTIGKDFKDRSARRFMKELTVSI